MSCEGWLIVMYNQCYSKMHSLWDNIPSNMYPLGCMSVTYMFHWNMSQGMLQHINHGGDGSQWLALFLTEHSPLEAWIEYVYVSFVQKILGPD